ncbi:MAG: asparagine synthase (glutamine-hydrolyzing) [Candidatus Eisenbacteria bacterium]|nr:asparagine synthase (glutamine-hydrolyzing) [Candidatus Eisenbacteria bacterium]
MCGFAAFFDPGGLLPDRAWLEGAAAALAHRGPDDQGFHAEPGVGLAFRRLAIVDLVSGAQPLANEDGTVWIAYNGEIYNHAGLRRELEAKGHRFRTRSDTEAIVHAYEEWGERCLERLRGMFAFALWDRKARRLFVARDRLGIKPLYWARAGNSWVFASEIKALFAFPGVAREVHRPGVVEHLTSRYVGSPATLFAGIEKLPPAHHLTVDARGVAIRRWWEVDWEPKSDPGEDAALAELEARLTESVRLRLMSDVPLGALLSGGVDSSVVVALAARLIPRPVQTFSVGFDAPGPCSELPYARTVAAHLGTEHREIVVGAEDVARELPRLAWHQDEPVSEPAAIPTFLVARLARETVTVVLTGEGGDELFAGYPKYAFDPLARRVAGLPAPLRALLLDGAVDRLPFRFRKLQVVGRSARFRDESERYAAWFAGFAGAERRRLLGPALRDHEAAAVRAFRRALESSRATRPLDRMLDVDLRLWLPDDLLMKMDKMSMAASIEARVPLLDHPLVEWAARLPDRYKVRGYQGKVLLKRLARKLVPREVVDRPKVGFTVPLAPWFRGPLRDLLCDTLLGPSCLQRGYYDPAVLRAYVEDHVRGRRDRSRELWTLLTLELWHRAFVDEAPRRPRAWTPPARVAAGAPR